MAEGGQLPWKRQTIDQSRGPAANYNAIQQPIALPAGLKWSFNASTREWKAVDKNLNKEEESLTNSTDATTTASSNSSDSSENSDTKKKKKASTSSEVKGRDYVLHTVLPEDTLAGLCLRYGCKALDVRRCNGFSGSNLNLVPAVLVIPLREGLGLNGRSIRQQDRSSPEFKMHAFLVEFPQLRQTEARSYLELADWDLEQAMEDAREDLAWERAQEEKAFAKQKQRLREVEHVKQKLREIEQEKQQWQENNKTSAETKKSQEKQQLPSMFESFGSPLVDVETAIPLFSSCLGGNERNKCDSVFAPVHDDQDDDLEKPLLLEMAKRGADPKVNQWR